MKDTYSIEYPRKIALRGFIKRIVRILLPILTRSEITGLDRIPATGPVILAGNHVAVMEIVMMLAYAPRQVEFVGAGDIPMEPTLAPFAKLYGFIPLRRGMVDRTGLRTARDVLAQKGFLVVFPEGGIWNPADMSARVGIAWLSQETQAPVVPVGFGGMQGALKKLLRLRRPRMVMNVGEPIAPVPPVRPDENRRDRLEDSARIIFERIQALIPESERAIRASLFSETYELRILLHQGEKTPDITQQIDDSQQRAVAHFFCQPVLLDALRRNLHLDVSVLQHLDETTDAGAIAKACRTVLRYLEVNPGFLTYRFGMEEGIAAAEGLSRLAEMAEKVAENRQGLSIEAIHLYRKGEDGEVVFEPFGRKKMSF